MTRRRLLSAASAAASVASLAQLARADTPLALFELRSYRTQPGRREELIAMFEAHFLDAYEAAGATIVATFRHRGDADRWVWIRVFADAASREAALRGFYGGATWKRLAAACNATIADVGDAWLLGPVDAPRLVQPPPRPPAGAAETPASPWTATLMPVPPRQAPAVAARWRAAAPGAPILATATGIPRHPQRPLRPGHWVVALARGAQVPTTPTDIAPLLRQPAETWPLAPTARSALR